MEMRTLRPGPTRLRLSSGSTIHRQRTTIINHFTIVIDREHSMAQLDKLIERLQLSQEIIIESGRPPMLSSDGTMKAMSNQQLSTQQIIPLLQEIAPATAKIALGQRKATRFEYSLGDKSVVVLFSLQGDQANAKIAIPGYEEDVAGSDSQRPVPEQAPAPAAAPRSAGPGGEPEIGALLRKMFQMGASDLHLTSSHRPLVRLHGDMRELTEEPALPPDRIKALVSAIMPSYNAAQFQDIHDTDFAYEIPGLVRFRVNVFLDRLGMGAVFRQIPMEVVTAEKLGLSKEILDLCFLSKGLVLITGPTGSGKSTTLCALVDHMNRHRKDHIITIEDPIEFVHLKNNCLINQREVHVHTQSFANALRAALREDPDIVLVGEMHDLETIAIAVETAETGHLVFGTLHTTTAASTVDRIIDQFPADRQSQMRTMLASSLKGVIAQTLCKKIGGGRIAAMEVLLVNSAVSNLIREGKIYQIPSVMQTAKGQGMILLNESLLKLVMEKQVAPEEAYRKAIDKPGFAAMLKQKGLSVNAAGMID
jgi:twitching motility protein PilT